MQHQQQLSSYLDKSDLSSSSDSRSLITHKAVRRQVREHAILPRKPTYHLGRVDALLDDYISSWCSSIETGSLQAQLRVQHYALSIVADIREEIPTRRAKMTEAWGRDYTDYLRIKPYNLVRLSMLRRTV